MAPRVRSDGPIAAQLIACIGEGRPATAPELEGLARRIWQEACPSALTLSREDALAGTDCPALALRFATLALHGSELSRV